MGTHKIYSGIQGIRDNISGSLYGDCHELLAPLCHVCEMFICLEFFECHKVRSVHADNLGDSFLGRCHAESALCTAHENIVR